jgi:hypothetical protein
VWLLWILRRAYEWIFQTEEPDFDQLLHEDQMDEEDEEDEDEDDFPI